jgi:membrane protein implicated in regulation of membrane protease activity
MNTLFLVCFLVGLSLSVVSFMSGHHLHVMKHGHHGHGLRGRLSMFNMAAITAFLAWFGGSGIVLQQVTHLGLLPLTGASVVVGIAGGSAINRFLRSLMSREKPLEASTIVGKVAQVTSPIREGGTGEIVYSLHGTRHAEAARAESGASIEKGSQVVVIRHEKGIAYVSTWDELSALTRES